MQRYARSIDITLNETGSNYIYQSSDEVGKKFQRLCPFFEVKYFVSVPQIDIVTKTGSSYILDYVSHTGGTVMAVPMFTTSACSIVLMSITLDIVLRLSATVSNRKLLYGACRRKTARNSTRDVAVVLPVLSHTVSLHWLFCMFHNLSYKLTPFNRPFYQQWTCSDISFKAISGLQPIYMYFRHNGTLRILTPIDRQSLKILTEFFLNFSVNAKIWDVITAGLAAPYLYFR